MEAWEGERARYMEQDTTYSGPQEQTGTRVTKLEVKLHMLTSARGK
jgi:hypothetical protein